MAEYFRTKPEMLFDQAPMTIQVYLMKAHTCIDKQFGEGYAKANPNLVAAFILACVADFYTGFVGNHDD